MIAIDSYVVRVYGNVEEVLQVVGHHANACHLCDASGNDVALVDSNMLTEVSFENVIIYEHDGKSEWVMKKDA